MSSPLTFANILNGEMDVNRNYIKELEAHRENLKNKTYKHPRNSFFNDMRTLSLESKIRKQEEYKREEDERQKLAEEKRQARIQQITMARIEREKQENADFEKKGCVGKLCARVKRVIKGTHTFKGERKMPKGGKRARTRKSQRKSLRK